MYSTPNPPARAEVNTRDRHNLRMGRHAPLPALFQTPKTFPTKSNNSVIAASKPLPHSCEFFFIAIRNLLNYSDILSY